MLILFFLILSLAEQQLSGLSVGEHCKQKILEPNCVQLHGWSVIAKEINYKAARIIEIHSDNKVIIFAYVYA